MHELLIGKVVAGGAGLGRLPDGKAVFVDGALPGERVRARIVERRRDFARALLVEVVEASPHRVEPPCPLARSPQVGRPRPPGEACGGCDWMHIESSHQLALKREIVREALLRTGRLASPPPISGPEPAEAFGYRNRVQLHKARGGGVGFMAATSRHIVKAERCPVSVGPINQLLAREAEHGRPASSEATRAPTAAMGAPAADASSSLDRFTVFSDGRWLAREGADEERTLAVEVAGRPIRFSVGCFFQSNLAALERLARYVEGEMGKAAAAGGPRRRAADLYAGVGLFAAIAAAHFERIIAVESATLSASFIPRNASSPGLEVFPMTVEQWIQSLGRAAAPPGAAESFDFAIVDPPRAGLSAEARTWLARARPRRLVYVSCNPVTLARDVGELSRDQFAIEEIRLFDFFPQTSHVESVAVLTPAPGP